MGGATVILVMCDYTYLYKLYIINAAIYYVLEVCVMLDTDKMAMFLMVRK